MRTVLADICVLLWAALSVAYGFTHTDYGPFFVTFLPSVSVVLIMLVTYPLTVGVLFAEVFRRGRA